MLLCRSLLVDPTPALQHPARYHRQPTAARVRHFQGANRNQHSACEPVGSDVTAWLAPITCDQRDKECLNGSRGAGPIRESPVILRQSRAR